MSFFGALVGGKAAQQAANYNADKLTGQITTNYASSGVTYSGSVLEVLLENELNLERDRDMMKYNAEVARDQKYNEAINQRAEASIERYRGKIAKKVSYYQAGQSLLNLGGKFLF